MTAPAWSTDLTDIFLDSGGTMTRVGAGPGTVTNPETDFYIQGSSCASLSAWTNNTKGLIYTIGSDIYGSIPTDGIIIVWGYYSAVASLAAAASGGYQIIEGSSTTAYRQYYVAGSDTLAFDSWIPYVINVKNALHDTSTGSPTSASTSFVGAVAYLPSTAGPSKGAPFGIDAIRYGRHRLTYSAGDSGTKSTFSGAETYANNSTRRWGNIELARGVYRVQGFHRFGATSVTTTQRARATNVATLTTSSAHNLTVGTVITVSGLGGTGYNATAAITAVPSTTSLSYANTGGDEGTTADTGGTVAVPVDFSDSNKVLLIRSGSKVTSAYNRFEVQGTGSSVVMDNIIIQSLNTTSRGTWVSTAGTVTLTSCQFIDMNTFTFLSTGTVTDCVFRRTNAVTAPGTTLTGTKILASTVAADASALVWNVATDPDGKLDNMTFSKGTNAHHAINLGASCPTTVTLRGITFTGFNAANAANDSVLYLSDQGSDKTWTINAVGCTGTVSYKKARAGDTVSVVVDPVTFAVHVQDINTGADINGARVWVPVTSTVGGRPYNSSITSINRSGSTATVVMGAVHGLANNDYVWIQGATEPEYNGTHQVTVTSTTDFTYTVSGTPSTPAGGTKTATFVVLSGTTTGTGDISASYTWTNNQPVSGRVRTASGAGPYYKTAPVSGTIDKTSGLSVTVQMIPDD